MQNSIILICKDFKVVVFLNVHLHVIPNIILSDNERINSDCLKDEVERIWSFSSQCGKADFFLTLIRWRRRSRSLRRRPRFGGPNGRPTTRLYCRWQKRWGIIEQLFLKQASFHISIQGRTVRNLCWRAIYIKVKSQCFFSVRDTIIVY